MSERLLLFFLFLGTDLLIFVGVIAWIVITDGVKGKITFKIDKHRYFRRERSNARGWRMRMRGMVFTFLLCQQHCHAGALGKSTLVSEDLRGVPTMGSSGYAFEDDYNSLMTRQETRHERVDDNFDLDDGVSRGEPPNDDYDIPSDRSEGGSDGGYHRFPA